MWRCRQCGWTMNPESARLPRYGARLRCPACSALLVLIVPDDGNNGDERAQSGDSAPTRAHPPEVSLSPGAARPPEVSHSPGAARPPETAHSPDAARPPEATISPEETSSPTSARPKDSAALRNSAREVLRRWLTDVADRGKVDEATIFREHGDELARMMEIWQASYPDKDARRIFREELFTILESFGREGQ